MLLVHMCIYGEWMDACHLPYYSLTYVASSDILRTDRANILVFTLCPLALSVISSRLFLREL